MIVGTGWRCCTVDNWVGLSDPYSDWVVGFYSVVAFALVAATVDRYDLENYCHGVGDACFEGDVGSWVFGMSALDGLVCVCLRDTDHKSGNLHRVEF